MSTVRRFKQNDNIDADDLSGDDVIPIEHDPSGSGDEDRALTVKQAKKYIYDNLPMTYNGTATINNDTGLISATISDIDSSFSIKTGFRFRLVFSTTATYNSVYTMSINGGTAYQVSISNNTSIVGAFQNNTSYDFVFTGSKYDFIGNVKYVGSDSNYLFNYSSYTTIADLFTYLPTSYVSAWIQVSGSTGATLYTNGVLPVSKGGILHLVKMGNSGRALAEFTADDNSRYIAEFSNLSTSTTSWKKITLT